MLMNYLDISIFYSMIPLALVIFFIYFGIKFFIKRKVEMKPLKMMCEFAWILIVLFILVTTGFLEGNFSLTSIATGNVNYSFTIFEEGISKDIALNLILFILFGFFLTAIFKKIREKISYGFLIGLAVSIIIEFIKVVTNGLIQLDNILINTLGAYTGYLICIYILEFKNKNLF
ncbi:VanZ family protein [Clostridium septicum]|uniref:VanZ family protein n=2 Tax=Clostridium septicum TaxID=1504 RepID=A0A9N7JMR2_CLOSE|nr:VanZ family protein [Clostridium septicum]QAS60588.1 VanZ family protein [Clostridium septicum]